MSKLPIKLFLSYSHDDENYFIIFKEGLTAHLSISVQYEFKIWDDSKILPGTEWRKDIETNLSRSDIGIFCVSANFLGSRFIKVEEFGRIIEKFPNTIVIPVYFKHCNYKSWEELSERQFFKPGGEQYGSGTIADFAFSNLIDARRSDGKPNDNPFRDFYFKELAGKIEEIVNEKQSHRRQISKRPAEVKYINFSSYPYFESESFFGRDELLETIDKKIKSSNIPLLLSGIGGMGKTAVAVAYGKDERFCSTYDNIAWVSVSENIFSNLFKSFHANPVIPFEYSSAGDSQKNIEALMGLLKDLPGNNLLLIDNVNDEDDLRQFITVWKRYLPGVKCLITTRCNISYNNLIELQTISYEAATALFKSYNSEEFDDISFTSIYDYIGGHTLLIELLAKFGQESNLINSTAEILDHLEKKGVRSLSKVVRAKQGVQDETDKSVSEFVMSLYNPLKLTEEQQEHMRYFSILPATEIDFNVLMYLFGIDEEDKEEFDTQINILTRQGWLLQKGKRLKCHQIIQEICRGKLNPTAANSRILILQLSSLFENKYDSNSSSFFEIALTIINNLKEKDLPLALMQLDIADRMIETGNLNESLGILNSIKETLEFFNRQNDVAICFERMGKIYIAQEDLKNALTCFKDYNTIEKELAKNNPEEPLYTNNFGISYQFLGRVYEKQNDLDEAFNCYQEYNKIEKDLSEKYPDSTKYKNGLAISYQFLGWIYYKKDNLDEALRCFLEDNLIEKELVKNNPRNTEFKNGLAVSFQNIGIIYQEKGNSEKAFENFTQYNTIEKELARDNPAVVEFQNGLAFSFVKLGSVSPENNKHAFYTEALKIWEDLVEKVPSHAEFRNNLDWVKSLLPE